MELDVLRIGIDFSLVVLIWMVQLLIYPSFLYYSREELHRWHFKYTFRIGSIVIPLMLIQVFVYGTQLMSNQQMFEIGGALIVILIWIITLFRFVPMHNSIMNKNYEEGLLKRLISTNWIRTMLWTILFVWSITVYLFG